MTNTNHQLTQRAPILTVQPDLPLYRRVAGGVAGLGFAALSALGALAAFGPHEAGLFPIGLGRLCDYLLDNNIPGASLLAFLERGHVAVMLAIGAMLLLFGRSATPQPGAGQKIVFHRRATLRRQLPALLGSFGLLAIGAWAAVAIHPVVAGLLELPATLLIGWFAWHALIPEMRTALTVIVDQRQGFGNRIVISGGLFNKTGRVTIRHDDLDQAQVLEPTWTRLFAYRDLFLTRRNGGQWRIDAIAPSGEMSELAEYLNGDFGYGIGRPGLVWNTRLAGASGGGGWA